MKTIYLRAEFPDCGADFPVDHDISDLNPDEVAAVVARYGITLFDVLEFLELHEFTQLEWTELQETLKLVRKPARVAQS